VTLEELNDALFHICLVEKTYRWAYMRLLNYPDIQIQHKNVLTKGLQAVDRVEDTLKRWHKEQAVKNGKEERQKRQEVEAI